VAKINNTNNASGSLTIDPGASGDSFLQFNLASTTNEFIIGVDDTDSDAFVIAQGGALGTTNTFRMSAAGERTLPLQCFFLNSINAEANASGDGTTHNVGSITATTSIIDRNGDMTEGDGAGTGATFTAPVDGFYQFNFILQIDIDATGGDYIAIQVATTSRTFYVTLYPTENVIASLKGLSNYLGFSGTFFEDMSASDTAVFQFISGPSGSKTDDIIDGYISGGLMG